jgi:acyl carrier protein
MPREETTAFIAEMAERVGGPPATQVTQDSSLSDLGIDSLSMIEIIVAAEDRFGVRIVDDDASRFRTVSDVAAYIEDQRIAK